MRIDITPADEGAEMVSHNWTQYGNLQKGLTALVDIRLDMYRAGDNGAASQEEAIAGLRAAEKALMDAQDALILDISVLQNGGWES